jgi:hypothetical protein
MYGAPFRVLILLFTLFPLLLTSVSAEDVERRRIAAVRVEHGPKIDGKLDDPVWQKARPSDEFIQLKPHKGKPMTQQTVIRVLYDDENIYVGFECYDSEPEKVLGTEMRRDYEVWDTNDYIRFVLDTYHDLRSAYYFGTNPRGAKVDARITDNGRFHLNWDAVWDCAATRHSRGWSAEFAIPFSQLRFPQKEEQVWGFNAARTIRRMDEEGAWSATGIDKINVISGAGELVGLRDLPQGLQLEIRPSLVLGAEGNYYSKTKVEYVRRPSLDVKYGLRSGLTLSVTANTDFAQVEADEERVNLSRFDMFFPEKRPFFLEGVGIFGAPDPIFSKTLPLFYSRRIGIAGGKEARILGGLKLTGKLGKQSIGLLSVQTDDVDEIPSTNFSAFRVQRDVLRSSSVGLIFLNKLPGGGEGDNQTLGIDVRFNPSSELTLLGSLAKTWTDGLDGRDMAGQLCGEWRTTTWNIGGSYRDIQEHFNAEMGFIRRTDIRESVFWWGKSFEIRKGILRSTGGRGHYAVTTNHNGRLESRSIGFEWGLELETGDSGGFGMEPHWEYLPGDWEIRKGIVIPKGLHRWLSYGVGCETDDSRWLKIGGVVSGGGFYNGSRRSISVSGHIRPLPNLLITGSYDWNSIELPGGSFTTNTVNSRWIYNVSPDFFIKLFLQWNDDSDLVRSNFLIRYTYRPGSDFYIVYNQLWQSGKVTQRSIVGKLTYFFNL